jgi:hypothetical protein
LNPRPHRQAPFIAFDDADLEATPERGIRTALDESSDGGPTDVDSTARFRSAPRSAKNVVEHSHLDDPTRVERAKHASKAAAKALATARPSAVDR